MRQFQQKVFSATQVSISSRISGKKELKRKLMFWKNLARLGRRSSCTICVKVMHCSLPMVAPPGGGGVGPLLTPLGASFLPLNWGRAPSRQSSAPSSTLLPAPTIPPGRKFKAGARISIRALSHNLNGESLQHFAFGIMTKKLQYLKDGNVLSMTMMTMIRCDCNVLIWGGLSWGTRHWHRVPTTLISLCSNQRRPRFLY